MTSKVVSMAPCSDRKGGKKEVMMMEGSKEERKEGTEIGRLIKRLQDKRGAQQKGNLKVLESKPSFRSYPEKSRVRKTERERERERWLDWTVLEN